MPSTRVRVRNAASASSIGHGDVVGPSHVLEPGVLRAHAGIIETSGDGMGFGNLPIFIFHQIGAIAMQHTRTPGIQRRRMLA